MQIYRALGGGWEMGRQQLPGAVPIVSVSRGRPVGPATALEPSGEVVPLPNEEAWPIAPPLTPPSSAGPIIP